MAISVIWSFLFVYMRFPDLEQCKRLGSFRMATFQDNLTTGAVTLNPRPAFRILKQLEISSIFEEKSIFWAQLN